MINFTVGPVQSSDAVRAIGAEQVPYFRTAEFSEMMLENERLVKKFANATKDSKVVFMTCSGSGGMEAAIINCLTPQDKALVINILLNMRARVTLLSLCRSTKLLRGYITISILFLIFANVIIVS